MRKGKNKEREKYTHIYMKYIHLINIYMKYISEIYIFKMADIVVLLISISLLKGMKTINASFFWPVLHVPGNLNLLEDNNTKYNKYC